jgi:hypothetical protein
MEKQYVRETLLITAAELKQKLGAANLCMIDTRPAEDMRKATSRAPRTSIFLA